MTVNKVYIGNVPIGGGENISVQSMTNTDTKNVAATVAQINALEQAGCDIVRLAVIDKDAASAIKDIKAQTNIPIVADIHFDYRLAMIAMESGVDSLRLNPGNIREQEKVRKVITEAKDRNLTIRVGVNGGSIDRDKYREVNAESMVASAMEHIKLMEDLDFTNIKVSLKASDIKTTIEANRLFRSKYAYPLHLGVTEAGTLRSSLVKSSLGIGSLLLDGIGDTIRFSITGNPVEEVVAGKSLLKFLGLSHEKSIEIISCPTCGRTAGQIESVANEVELRTRGIKKDITIAIMGCIVNGPGEAREADFGVACSASGDYLFFEKDNKPIKIKKEDTVNFLLEKVDSF